MVLAADGGPSWRPLILVAWLLLAFGIMGWMLDTLCFKYMALAPPFLLNYNSSWLLVGYCRILSKGIRRRYGGEVIKGREALAPGHF